MKRPSASFMMFALCTEVTFLRPFFCAKSNANSATRVEATRVMTCSGGGDGHGFVVWS